MDWGLLSKAANYFRLTSSNTQANAVVNSEIHEIIKILSNKLIPNEDEKIVLLQKILTKVTVLHLTLAISNVSEMDSIQPNSIRITESDLGLITKALANLAHDSTLVADYGISHQEQIINLLTEKLEMKATSMALGGCYPNDMKTFSKITFRAEKSSYPNIHLKECILTIPPHNNHQVDLEFWSRVVQKTETLTISNDDISSKASLFEKIFEKDFPLTHLKLENIVFDDDEIKILTEYVNRSTTLKRLYIRETVNQAEAPQGMLAFMLSISHNKSLSAVHIFGNKIGNWVKAQDDFFKFLEELKANTSLNILILSVRSESLSGNDSDSASFNQKSKVQEVLRFNTALHNITLNGYSYKTNLGNQLGALKEDKFISTSLQGNIIAQQLQGRIATEELVYCAPEIPTEVLQIIDKKIVLQGKSENMQQASRIIHER